ncbi:acyl-CoA N-acyltransferase [Xylaria arbuscula]|nr:acyl-CoA N-acyltransferase [Xylaria arbuscula]
MFTVIFSITQFSQIRSSSPLSMSSSPSRSSGTREMPVSIQALNFHDIPACAQLTAAAFATDPHTIVKQFGRQPYDMFTMTSSSLEESFKRENFIYVKAVDEQGAVVGHAGWVISGAGQKRAPSRNTADERLVAENGQGAETDKPKECGGVKEDPIERLHSLEEADTQYWLRDLVPGDMPCMFVVGLTVSPSHQGQGIGSALLRYGNDIAEEKGLSIWAHSSHQAYATYKKIGFETRHELRIDLDDYAPRPPREGESTMAGRQDGKWGHYVIRYMERKPGGN